MPPYMRKDSHGYRFRRPIPKELVDFFDKANFVKRLGHDHKKARELCAELTVQTDKLLASARDHHARLDDIDAYLKHPRETRLKKLSVSPELAGQLANLWLRQSLKADAQARKVGLEDDEFDLLDKSIKEIFPTINRALATGQVDKFHLFIHELVTWRGYEFDETTDEQLQNLTYEVLKHVQAGYKILAARQQGDFLELPDSSKLPPPLPAAWEKTPPPSSEPAGRLRDITSLYQEHLQTSSTKTQSTYMSIWLRFVDFASNKPLKSITSGDIFAFLKSRLHAHDKPWSYKYTSGRVKRVLLEAFGLAKTNNLIEKNPVAELEVLPKISAKDEESRLKPRFPYKAEHLSSLFSSEWYNSASTAWRGKMKDDLGARYWIPLLCMWHGFRVSEAAQLQIHDVDVAHAQIKIQVSEAKDVIGPERSLKNSATSREIPIHPVLLELGFTDFVRTLSLHYAEGPLFPSALPEKGGRSPKWGRAYEQAFLRFMRDTLKLGSGYGNHSFRHALEDRIRAANVKQPWPEGLARAYTGRAKNRPQDRAVTREEGSEQHYGDGYSPSDMLHYVQKITYPDVALPLPFRVWLEDREVISNRLLALVRQWQT